MFQLVLHKIRNSTLLKQVWVVSSMWVYNFTVGIGVSYPSCLLPALRDKNSNFDVDLNTSSWIASLVGFSSLLGFFLVAFSMEYFGRKKSIILIVLPGVFGWSLISIASSITSIFIGRTLTGITMGCIIGLSAVIIAEYSSPEYRGSFLNAKLSSAFLGNTSVHILQYFLTWRQIALIAATFNLIPVICLLKFPESPTWLAANGRFEDCKKSFLWLRGTSDASVRESDALVESFKVKIKEQEGNCKYLDKFVEFLKNFQRKQFYKPLLIIWLSMTLFELCGKNYIVSYALDIIGEISEDKTQSFYAILGIDSLLLVYGLTSPTIVRFTKRRSLLFGASFLALVVLTMFCVYLFLVSIEIIPNVMSWIPLSMFAIYFLLANYGCCTVPYIYFGELLPVSNKGVGTALLGLITSINLQVSLLCFPYLMLYIKLYGALALMGVIMLIILIILYFILPETKDKTLLEINNFFLYGTCEIESGIDKNVDKTNCCLRSEVVKIDL